MSSDPIQAAEKLALSVWDFLSEHRVAGSVTDEARSARLATAALRHKLTIRKETQLNITQIDARDREIKARAA